MMKHRFTGLILLVAFLLVIAACSSEQTTQESDPSSPPSESEENNESSTEEEGESHLLTERLAAPDLSKLPDRAKQRDDTIIVSLVNPSGAFTPYFTQVGYDGNVNIV